MRARDLITIALALGASGCAFTTTARDWNGLHGVEGKPRYYASATKVGVKLLSVIPFLGDMGISGLTEHLTGDIREEGGNEVRIVQGTEESYFYGFPPFTWVVTPVISTVAMEYTPDPEVYAKDQAAIAVVHERGWRGRWYKPWRW
jgi:hypothetical protein